MNRITEITRRNIFDTLVAEGVNWNGRLSEPDFLMRVFDLKQMPSIDVRFPNAYGDIFQHRINNYDWDHNWVFSDERLDLLQCDDSIFLQFLCEMIHPVVRTDLTEVNRLKQIFNDYLSVDGYEIIEKTQISDKPIFAARLKFDSKSPLTKHKKEITKILNEDYVLSQINIMEGNTDSAPHLAIGIAKELIETICKTILSERKTKIDANWDLIRLIKETNKILKLAPTDIPNEAKAVETIRSILGSLSTIVHGMCELRNHYGTGHGKESSFRGLSPRHAKLAVGAATTLAIFLLETHKIR